MGDEGGELRRVEGIGLQHIGHEAELFLAFGEIGGHFRGKRRRRQVERGDLGVIVCRGAGARLGRAVGGGGFAVALYHGLGVPAVMPRSDDRR